MLKVILVGSMIFLFGHISFADPVPKFGDIVRNADGSVRDMNQDSAIQYCASQGMRLPSARELAQLSQSRGAAGISDTPKDGYYLLRVINADGNSDSFYFNHAGYKLPAGELGEKLFWSSSIFWGSSDVAYSLYGDNGGIYYGLRSDNLAVQCIAGR